MPKQEELLTKILREDHEPKNRSFALYLLAYLESGPKVMEHVNYGLLDPADEVRDAGMDILTDIAIFQKDIALPIELVIKMLDFPSPNDRSRALSLMLTLASRKDYRDHLLFQASDQFLKLLRSKHPTNHEMAHIVLRLLAGEDFPERDYNAWDQWVWKARRKNISE